jgi:PAS domain S-box-containing protein
MINSGVVAMQPSCSERVDTLRELVLGISSELIESKTEAIPQIIANGLNSARIIGGADQIGWLSLADTGSFGEIFYPSSFRISSAVRKSLDGLPWCRTELRERRPVIFDRLSDLPAAGSKEMETLRNIGSRSAILLPSAPICSKRPVLFLSSATEGLVWTGSMIEQLKLLQNLFWSAYQRLIAHNEIQQTLKSFQHLFQTSNTAIAILNKEGRPIWTNDALCQLLGYKRSELREITLAEIMEPGPRIGAENRDKIKRGISQECRLRHKSSSWVPCKIAIEAIVNEPLGYSYSLLRIEDGAAENELQRRQNEVRNLTAQLIESQENDRKRLSRELHDDIGQRLSLATSELGLIACQNSGAANRGSAQLHALHEELDSLCTDVHEMSHNLHSYKLQHLGLSAALKDLARRLAQPTFRVDLNCEPFEEPVSSDVTLCLYRIAQEALNNALRHSHSPVAAVVISRLQNTFYMVVQDAGIGFDSTRNSPGLGLLSMRERVGLLNGTFRLHSTPGRGTEIWVELKDA